MLYVERYKKCKLKHISNTLAKARLDKNINEITVHAKRDLQIKNFVKLYNFLARQLMTGRC